MKSKINIVQFIDWRCFFFIIDTCGVLKKGLPEKGPTKFHFSRDYWLFYTAISRKVIWDMINTLFLILSVAVDRTFVFFFWHLQTFIHGLSCHSFKLLWRTVNSKPPTIPFGIVVCTFSYNLSRNSCIPVMYFSLRSRLAYFPLTLTEQYYEAKDLSSFPVNKGTSWRFGFKKCGHVT